MTAIQASYKCVFEKRKTRHRPGLSVGKQDNLLVGAHGERRDRHGSAEAEDDGGVRRDDFLAILLEPPCGADSCSDAGTNEGSGDAAEHGSCGCRAAGGKRHGGEGSLDVVAAEDGAFAVDAGDIVLAGVDDLCVEDVVGAVGKRN